MGTARRDRREDFVLVEGRREFEADGADELVKVVGDALIEAVELREFAGKEPSIGWDGAEESGG